MKQGLAFFLLVLLLGACSAKFLKVDDEGKIGDIKEYDKALKVKAIPEKKKKVIPKNKTQTLVVTTTTKRVYEQKKIETPPPPKKKRLKKHYPAIEDSEGFDGRRPLIDPFRVGEKVTLAVKYFGMNAGKMEIMVLPFKEVNGKKSYHFQVRAQTSPFFNAFYAVEDVAETFVDYEEMIPYNFAIHIKESKQLKEVRSYFDWKALKSHYWEKKITKKKGERTKKYEWDIQKYSQNIFSGPFVFRTFTLRPGKKIKMRLADEKKNMVVTTDVLRRETIDTAIGKLDTLVIRPKVQIEGNFKPMGDVLFWVTNDDRKFIVRIKSKIKIGSIYAELIDLDPGKP